jgi:hypothetical protein
MDKANALKLARFVPIAALFLFGLQTDTAFAQRFELGGLAGGGAFAVSSGGASGSGQLGVEACIWCRGRFALFGEYAHWISAGNSATSDRIKSADLGGGGLRIQWSRTLRPFLDVGLVGGRDQHQTRPGGVIGGIVVGAGIGVPVAAHWYVRPQVRVYGLSPHTLEGVDAHWAVGASLGVGYLF